MKADTGKKILLVEDEIIIAMNESLFLEKNGFSVVTAVSGKKAVELLEKEHDFDLILMDIDLGPGMDGTEAARIIIEKNDIPIIFLSSHTEEHIVSKTEEITSYGYVVKNSGETVILASIKMAFKLHRANRDLKKRKAELQEALSKHEIYELQINEQNTSLTAANEELQAALEEFEVTNEELIDSQDVLIKNERRFRDIVETSPMGIHQYYVMDEKLIFTGGNKAADRILGIDHNELIGKTIEEAFPPLAETEIPSIYKKAAIEGKSWHTESISYEDNRIVGAYDVTAFQTSDRNMAAMFFDITVKKNDEMVKAAIDRILKEKHDLLDKIFETAPAGITVLDKDGKIINANNQAVKLLRLKKDEIKERNFNAPQWQITDFSGNPFPEDKLPFMQVMRNRKPVRNISHAITLGNDNRIYLSINASPILTGDGEFNGMVASIEDITERKKTEDSLIENEEKYRHLFEAESDSIFLIENDSGIIIEANQAAEDLYGYSRKSLLTLKNEDLSAQPDQTKEVTQSTPVIKKNVVMIPLRYHKKKDGSIFPVEITGRFFEWRGKNVHIAAIRDISERLEKENDLIKAHEEKDALFLELQHRIKNSFSIIAGLINLELNRVSSNEESKNILKNIFSRIESLNSLYTLLSQTNDVKTIRMDVYLQKLTNSLLATISADHRGISIHYELDEITLDVRRAIPAGLLVNELITNSLKYAFDDMESGIIYLSFKKLKGSLILKISDNGKKFPDGFDIGNTDSLGLHLVHMLTRQIKGNLSIDLTDKKEFTIEIPST